MEEGATKDGGELGGKRVQRALCRIKESKGGENLARDVMGFRRNRRKEGGRKRYERQKGATSSEGETIREGCGSRGILSRAASKRPKKSREKRGQRWKHGKISHVTMASLGGIGSKETHWKKRETEKGGPEPLSIRTRIFGVQGRLCRSVVTQGRRALNRETEEIYPKKKKDQGKGSTVRNRGEGKRKTEETGKNQVKKERATKRPKKKIGKERDREKKDPLLPGLKGEESNYLFKGKPYPNQEG